MQVFHWNGENLDSQLRRLICFHHSRCAIRALHNSKCQPLFCENFMVTNEDGWSTENISQNLAVLSAHVWWQYKSKLKFFVHPNYSSTNTNLLALLCTRAILCGFECRLNKSLTLLYTDNKSESHENCTKVKDSVVLSGIRDWIAYLTQTVPVVPVVSFCNKMIITLSESSTHFTGEDKPIPDQAMIDSDCIVCLWGS